MSPLFTEAPYCVDASRDEAIRPVVERATEFVVQAVGPRQLEAVILTGSLSRGEGSVLLGDAHARLLGDVEFLVVLRSPFDWPSVRRRFAELTRVATQEAQAGPVRATVEYAPAGIEYLRRNIRPCIFAYDLREYGRVLWGRDDILDEISPFDPQAIPRHDAIELLMNRMVEHLELRDAPLLGMRQTVDVGYHSIKLMLDLAGSALAFSGQHSPRYADRLASFAALLNRTPPLQLHTSNTSALLGCLDEAVACKLRPTSHLLTSWVSGEHVRILPSWVQSVWSWEIQNLLGLSTSNVQELVQAYLAEETLLARARGWLKFLLHPLRPPRALRPAAFTLMHAGPSPRRSLYASAVLAFSASTDLAPRAATLSPLPTRRTSTRTPREVVELWRWLVRNN